jgi:hypothetical protein
MNEPDNHNIISLGDDFRQFDRKFWGWRDRARAAREDQQASLSDTWILGGDRPLPPDHVMAWQLHGSTKQDEARRRRLNIARLEQKFGLREESWF